MITLIPTIKWLKKRCALYVPSMANFGRRQIAIYPATGAKNAQLKKIRKNRKGIKMNSLCLQKNDSPTCTTTLTLFMNVADKYGCTVHKIDRYYPSSKTCTCGYVNKELKITDREWICPECGARHDRDLLAANNILRRGIDELGDKINPQPSRAAVFVKS